MKIALISSNPHNRIGGTETYARNLIECFSDKHIFTEYPIMKDGKEISKLDKRVKIDYSLIGAGPDDLIWYGTYKKKHLKKIYEENDVVILNNLFPPKKWLKHRKSILLQHMDVDFYTFWGKPFWLGVGSFFSWALFGVSGTIGNPFRKASNVVFFDKTTSCDTSAKKFYVPLPGEINKLEVKNRDGFVWIGRLDNPQKNIDDAAYIANNVANFSIYGDGPHKKRMLRKMEKKEQYKGSLAHKEVIEKMSSSEALVLTSSWEGFPFTIVEALHAGTNVFAYNTFKSLSYFEKSGKITIAKDKEHMVYLLNNFKSNNYSKDFARENLTITQFKEKWEKILGGFSG